MSLCNCTGVCTEFNEASSISTKHTHKETDPLQLRPPVLIPRPETEELVELLSRFVRQHRKSENRERLRPVLCQRSRQDAEHRGQRRVVAGEEEKKRKNDGKGKANTFQVGVSDRPLTRHQRPFRRVHRFTILTQK